MLKRHLAGHDVLFVAVHCPTDLLIEREMARGDREQGSAVSDQQVIHIGRVYDLEVNSMDDIDGNVDLILDAWRNGTRSSEFAPQEGSRQRNVTRGAAPPGRRQAPQHWW